MKCKNAEKWILLNDSGELDARRADLLRAHVETCESCRQFEQMIVTLKPACEFCAEPPATVLNNILREARKQVESKTVQLIYWKPVLAMAASVMIAIGLFFSHSGPGFSGDIAFTESDILELDAQIAGVMESGLPEDDLAFNFLMTYEGI
ncbi:MAG: zf-HC2 domain-containing protein [Kiritimatiellales bacterium]|nr:zf-HC2 domain-containing protein [Kiritimatiellales bacterium]